MTPARRVTVIIPTCDRAAPLAHALASVRRQELAPLEVIVVDDGIPGHAVTDVVASCGIPGARVVRNTRAKGPSGARNTGANQARGDVLAFLDDDDEWLPAYLRLLTNCLATADADVVCTDLLYLYEDGSERPGKSAPETLAAEAFLTCNPGLIGSNLALSRDLYLALGGFDESLPTSEDMDLGIRLSLQPQVRYAPLHTRLVRHHQHTQPRLCTPRTEAMREGVRRFFELHAARMSAAQRVQYGRAARALWGFDEHGRSAFP